MYFSQQDIQDFSKGKKIKFVNSLSGVKGVHLLGTKSGEGVLNLGLFTSVVHISSAPALIGVIFRPETPAHQSFRNIKENGYFTLNAVSSSFIEKAHYTSANFSDLESEFDICGFDQFFPGPKFRLWR